MGALLTTRIKARFNALKTIHFTFKEEVNVTSMSSAGKVMFAVFLDSQGVLLAHFQKHGAS
jgi:phage-related protein